MDRRAFVAFLAGLQPMIAGCKLNNPQPTGPVAFGFKMQWFTVQCELVQEVVNALRLVNARPANWQQGIETAYSLKGIFVAPPINGWIAIVGFSPEDFVGSDPVSPAKQRVESASKTFRVCCGFASHRVTEYHHWMRAEEGRVTRCFAYLGERGEILCNTGSVTTAEQSLSFTKLPPDQWKPDEDDVMRVAGVWSYDPSKLNSSSGPSALGVIAGWK